MAPAILKDTRETKKIKLQEIPGGEVVVYTDLLTGDVEDLLAQGLERSPSAILSKIIKEWNLTDEQGNQLEVNLENCRKLPVKDTMAIIKEAGLDDESFLEAGK